MFKIIDRLLFFGLILSFLFLGSQAHAETDCQDKGGKCGNSSTCDSLIYSLSKANECVEYCCVPKNNNNDNNSSNTTTNSGSTDTSFKNIEKIPGQDQTTDFVEYLKSLYNFGIAAAAVLAIFMIGLGAFTYIVTSAGNAGKMADGKDMIFSALYGLVLAMVAWLILYVINPDLVKGTLTGTTSTDQVVSSGGSSGGSSGSTSASCENANTLKSKLSSGSSLCGSSSCSKTCSLSSYESIIKSVANSEGVDASVIKALICRESGGNPNAHASDGGCGLMQITKDSYKSSCPSDILDPETNIKAGVALYKKKLSAVSGKSYGGGITKEQMAFAAYNCCANGDDPNSQSNDCKTADGWPALPKWACPINPGTGKYNMCFVKGYACDVDTCKSKY